MLIATHGVRLIARCFTRSEVISSLLCMEWSFMLIPIHGVTLLCPLLYWSKALCSLLYKE